MSSIVTVAVSSSLRTKQQSIKISSAAFSSWGTLRWLVVTSDADTLGAPRTGLANGSLHEWRSQQRSDHAGLERDSLRVPLLPPLTHPPPSQWPVLDAMFENFNLFLRATRCQLLLRSYRAQNAGGCVAHFSGPGKPRALAATHIRRTQIPPAVFRPVLMCSISPPCALNVTRFPAADKCDANI